MAKESILIDAEVPFERKLIVPFEPAAKAIPSSPPADAAGCVLGIRKMPEYLASDEMLERLVFNVLTTPNKVISASKGSVDMFKRLEQDAARVLVDLIRRSNPGKVNTTEDFVKLAVSDGTRSGEAYLGYKSRSIVEEELSRMFKVVTETD